MKRLQWRNHLPAMVLVAMLVGGRTAVFAQAAHPVVGILSGGKSWEPLIAGLKEGLEGLGYKQNKNISYLAEDTKGEITDLTAQARRLVEAKADVIFASPTAHTEAAMKATTTVPVVFAWVSDPIRSGLIASFASSKNNLTGVASHTGPLSATRLELLKEIAPGVKRVLTPVSPKEGVSESAYRYTETAAKQLGVQLVRREVSSTTDINTLMAKKLKGSGDAMFLLPSVLLTNQFEQFISKCLEEKLPLAVTAVGMVQHGALFTYGPDFYLVGVQSARLVDKVLKGEKPSDIPTETPAKLLLTVNGSTAKLLGLRIPRALASRIDKLVE